MSKRQAVSRVFLIGNAGKPEAVGAFKGLADWLDSQGLLAGSDLDGRPEVVNRAEPDFVIALGGDGTILHAGQAMGHRQVPIIGVNMGKLGYLADFNETELRENLDTLLSNAALISRRMMFDIRIIPPAGSITTAVALNDCVIRVGDPFRTITADISINEHRLCTLVGDGVILATPTGSTAHNMSCGGPILEPEVEAIIVTPKCPHSFTQRPIVVSPSSKVGILVLPHSLGAAAVIDGQHVSPLSPGTWVHAARSRHSLQLVRNPKRRQWDTLISKLKWGQDVT